jgi:hypothetical protein
VHLLLPHRPYIFDANCGYTINKGNTEPTSCREQAECALSLLTKFLNELKRIGRYQKSLIIVHADHGRRSDLSDLRSRELAKNASQALLLIKPVGRGSSDRFIVSDVESMLIDVAPTIADALDLPSNGEFEGISLLNLEEQITKGRKRTFCIYDKDELVQFNVNGRRFEIDKVIEK